MQFLFVCVSVLAVTKLVFIFDKTSLYMQSSVLDVVIDFSHNPTKQIWN